MVRQRPWPIYNGFNHRRTRATDAFNCRVMQEAPELRQPLEVAHIQAFVRASRK